MPGGKESQASLSLELSHTSLAETRIDPPRHARSTCGPESTLHVRRRKTTKNTSRRHAFAACVKVTYCNVLQHRGAVVVRGSNEHRAPSMRVGATFFGSARLRQHTVRMGGSSADWDVFLWHASLVVPRGLKFQEGTKCILWR
jgi:hypothetical protein